MRTVFKYPLEFDTDLKIPGDSAPLHIAFQNAKLCSWWEVDTDSPEITRQIRVIGTGHDVPEDSYYLGTVQDGYFVWHVYELMEIAEEA